MFILRRIFFRVEVPFKFITTLWSKDRIAINKTQRKRN